MESTRGDLTLAEIMSRTTLSACECYNHRARSDDETEEYIITVDGLGSPVHSWRGGIAVPHCEEGGGGLDRYMEP